MNIKNLSKIYLNTLPGLSENEKEKIANFNANSDYVAFSASSFKLKPGEMGSVDYYNTGIPTFTDWGAPKRVDEQGYVLVDLAEYNPWYTPHNSPLLTQRKMEGGNYERRNLDNVNYRRTPDGFLEAFSGPTGRWEKLQHAIPVQVEADAKWVKGGFLIEGVEVDPYTGNHLKDVPLSNLLTEAWLSQHEDLRGDPDDFDKIQSITFPEGAIGMNTDLFPWNKKETYFKGQTRVAVLPRDDNERNRYWLTIKKSDLENQRDPVDLVVGNLNFYPHDLQGKQNIKFFPDTVSLLTEINLGPEQPPNQNVPPILDNTAVQQYNEQIDQKLREFQEQFMDLQIKCDEKEAFLMSLEKESLPEVREQINIVFSPWEVPKYKKMLTGGAHDPTIKANNQAIETGNTQLIQQLENDFARKRAAIKELGKILESIENPNNPEPEPDSPPALQVFRQDAVDAIKIALNRDPKLTNDDLDQSCRDWEVLVNAANNEKEIDNIKDKVLINIGYKRKAKKEQKKVHDNLETEGKDVDQLKRQFEEIEKSRGKSVYETNRTDINSLKGELFKKVSKEEYLQIVADSIEKFLLKCSVGSNDLAPKNQRYLAKLKKGVIKDFSRINQAEEEVIKDAGQKGARKKLDFLFRQADSALRSGEKIKEIKNRLNGFRSSDEIYEKSLVSQKAKEIESYLNQLESYSAKDDSRSPSQENFPLTLVIPIFILVVFVIGVLVIYPKRRKRRTY